MWLSSLTSAACPQKARRRRARATVVWRSGFAQRDRRAGARRGGPRDVGRGEDGRSPPTAMRSPAGSSGRGASRRRSETSNVRRLAVVDARESCGGAGPQGAALELSGAVVGTSTRASMPRSCASAERGRLLAASSNARHDDEDAVRPPHARASAPGRSSKQESRCAGGEAPQAAFAAVRRTWAVPEGKARRWSTERQAAPPSS